MRTIIAEIVASLAATRQCEYIIEIYGVLIFSVSRIAASLAYRFLCERTFTVAIIS